MRTAAYVTPEDLDARSAAWLAHVRSRVAPRPHLVLDPDRCALLVIDLNRYFAQPEGRAFLPASRAVLPNVLALLDAWRARGSTVVFTRHGHAGPEDTGMLGRFFGDWIRADEPQADLLPELAPRSGELVLGKTTYDAFLGTGLQGILEARGVHQVLITGVLTHMCCETTARAAFTRGFDVHVVADATATTDEERHLCSLTALGAAVAVVHGTAEILS